MFICFGVLSTMPPVNFIHVLFSVVSTLSRKCNESRVRNKIIHSLPWITIFCHSWGDSAMIFTRDFVTRENHCRIASRVTNLNVDLLPWQLHNLHEDIKNNAWVTMNNVFCCHEWGDSAMIFTSDEVTSENHCRFASRVTKNHYSR